MKKNNKSVRKRELLDAISHCDWDKDKVMLLIDMVLSLEDCLLELNYNYSEVIIRFKNNQCAPLPF